MATVCGGTLALLDAGVPMTRPVAGISIGICTEHDDLDKIGAYKLMTDIIGWEDAFCDMDCKIAVGRKRGLPVFELDTESCAACPITSSPKRWKRRVWPGSPF